MSINIYKNLIYLLVLISFFGGIFNAQFINDGYHWGFIYSNAIDLLEGKIPYKEIFLEYGILQVLINSLIIKFVGNKLFYIYVFVAATYSLSLLLISKIIFKTIKNIKISFYSTLFLLIMYPWALSPWPIYLVLFFSSLFIYAIINKRFYLSGFYLFCTYLCFTTIFNIIIIFYIGSLYFLFLLINKKEKKNFLSKLIKIFSIYFICLLIFLFYLTINNIFFDWLIFQKLPFLIANNLEKDFLKLIIDYIYIVLIYPIFNIVHEPQWIFYSILFFSNLFLTFYFLIEIYKKKITNDLLNYIIVTLYLFFISVILGQSKNLTYIATSFSLSIFSFSYIYFLVKKENKTIINTIILLVIILSLFSYDMKNSNLAENRYKSLKSINLNNKIDKNNLTFEHFKWENNYWIFINKIDNTIKRIEKNCKNIIGINFTNDTFIYLLFKNKIQKIPFKLYKSKFEFDKLFDKELNSKINALIKSESLIMIANKSHEKNYFFNNNFSKVEILYNSNKIIKDNYNVYFPTKCY